MLHVIPFPATDPSTSSSLLGESTAESVPPVRRESRPAAENREEEAKEEGESAAGRNEEDEQEGAEEPFLSVT